MDLQVARPQSLGRLWDQRGVWLGGGGALPTPAPGGVGRWIPGASLFLQSREGGGGGVTGDAGGTEGEGYRLYCSEDFEQHVIR